MPCRAFIGLGSNLGDRKAQISEAIAQIDALRDVRVVKHSSLYEGEPHGEGAGGWFLNCAIEIETDLLPEKLLRKLRDIERAMGRKRGRSKPKNPEPRTIDLDILFFENQRIESPTLQLPHPEIANRRFVLLPLSELAPQLVHPVTGTTISQLLTASKDRKKLRLYHA
jgi:2-amino-4-hydroxy-6-hydroxymethyldihydropteridine diphosphokinase